MKTSTISRAYRIFPPTDTEKWARICEHIIRHYNEGWANGFHYGIKYWEIWNEPDNGIDERTNMMWHGSKEEYFELYRVTSKHLRKCFGDTIKIGGYASSGFYIAMLGDVGSIMATAVGQLEGYSVEWEERRRYFVTFFEEFLDIVVKERLPLDFFSHHSYASTEDTLKMQKYVEDKLSEAGLTETEIHLNEWNPNARISERGTALAAAEATAMMIAMQKTKMDMMCYYDARIGQSVFGGMFNPITYKPFAIYYAFKAFGFLYKLGTEIETTSDSNDVYVLAAKNEDRVGILISNRGNDTSISLSFNKELKSYIIDEENALTECAINKSDFTLKQNQVLYLETV